MSFHTSRRYTDDFKSAAMAHAMRHRGRYIGGQLTVVVEWATRLN